MLSLYTPFVSIVQTQPVKNITMIGGVGYNPHNSVNGQKLNGYITEQVRIRVNDNLMEYSVKGWYVTDRMKFKFVNFETDTFPLDFIVIDESV